MTSIGSPLPFFLLNYTELLENKQRYKIWLSKQNLKR